MGVSLGEKLMESNYDFNASTIIYGDVHSVAVVKEVQGEPSGDLYESVRCFCGILWGIILSVPIWALILWLLTWIGASLF